MPPFYSRDDGLVNRGDLLSLVGRTGPPAASGAQNAREAKPRGN